MIARRKKYFLIGALGVMFLLGARVVFAQSPGCGGIPFVPAIGIPGSPFTAGQRTNVDCTSIGVYLKWLYTYSIYVAAVVAAIVLMIGGFLWLTAGGNANQVSSARGYIAGALSGFVLLLLSWTLLQTINPNLTRFKPLSITPVGNVSAPATTNCQAYGATSDPSVGGSQPWVKTDGACGALDATQSCWCNTAVAQQAQGQSRCCYYMKTALCSGALKTCIDTTKVQAAFDTNNNATSCDFIAGETAGSVLIGAGGDCNAAAEQDQNNAPLCSQCH